MKKCVILAFMLLSLTGFSQNNSAVKGSWIGTLELPGIKLRVVIHINAENNTLKAEMDSPDQGAKGIPVDSIEFKNDSLYFKLDRLRITYAGLLSKGQASINGIFEQAGRKIPLVLTRMDKELSFTRLQDPKPPYPYTEELVSYENPVAGITLAGTLTYPSAGNNFPAVILISGSGPQDRNEFILGHKPFLVLADYLTRKGIAVLRFDDRGFGKSTGDFASATSADFATDVAAGISFLKTRKDIDPRQIGLIGHSEGGMIAPMVAAENENVAFIILMAGPGITGREILITQTTERYKKMGATETEISAILESSEKATGFALQEHNVEKQRKECERLIQQYFSAMSESRRNELGITTENYMQGLKMAETPWLKYFIGYDPAPALQKIKIPVLAVNGAKDVQVLADINLQGIETALKKGGNKNYEIHKLEGLNHLFQKAETGMTDEYSVIEETINPQFLSLVGNWVLKVSQESR